MAVASVRLIVPFEIKDAAAAVSIRAAAPKHFATEIIPQMLVPQKEADVYPAVMRLIEDDHDMAVKTKKELRGLLEEGKKADFLAQSFLYAITKDNRAPASEPPTLSDNLANLQSILSKLSKPVALVPPDELMSHEMIYVQALPSICIHLRYQHECPPFCTESAFHKRSPPSRRMIAHIG